MLPTSQAPPPSVTPSAAPSSIPPETSHIGPEDNPEFMRGAEERRLRAWEEELRRREEELRRRERGEES